jgi:glycosyltransferase involved in cell wall biosynthesis
MFAYWGTRGALSQLTYDLAQQSLRKLEPACTFSISGTNEIHDRFSFLDDGLFSIDDLRRTTLLSPGAIWNVKAALGRRFARDRTRAIVTLMSHMWSPLMVSTIRRAGVRHVVVVHDADCHPGDHHSLVNHWLLRESVKADHIVALTHSVAQRLVARGFREDKMSVLFLPDLNYGRPAPDDVAPRQRLRVLFVGRILPYKGLGLLVEAVEMLRAAGVEVDLGVCGEGTIAPTLRKRLSALAAEVDNRWIPHDEFKHVLSRYDVVVAPHTEASQSGVISAAFGAGLPVVTTPVGGLVEQVVPGVSGVIAEAPTAAALAASIGSIATDSAFLAQLQAGVAATCHERSVERFFDMLCKIALGNMS